MSDKIRSLRKSKGLSQEMLAESAGINLRTLQRIETGNAIPRGETLRLIAKALEIPVEDLSDSMAPADKVEDKGFLKLMNLSTLSFWFIPFGNILVPLAFWIFRKDTINGVRDLGKRIFIFQVIWSLITYGPIMALMFIVPFGSISLKRPEMIFGGTMIFVVLLYIINTAFILVTTFRIARNQEDSYALA